MTPHDERVLAMDLRARSFGYAVFEGPTRLLDWGVKSFRYGVNAVNTPANEKCAALMHDFSPSVVLLKKRDGDWNEKRREMYAAVMAEAAKRGIRVRMFSRQRVKDAFAGSNRNRYAIAAALAKRFPELAPRLPSPPKIWKSEDYRLSIFDAAALALTYFPPNEPVPQT